MPEPQKRAERAKASPPPKGAAEAKKASLPPQKEPEELPVSDFDEEEIVSEQIDEDVEDEMDVLNSGKNDALEFEEVEQKDEEREQVQKSLQKEIEGIPQKYDDEEPKKAAPKKQAATKTAKAAPKDTQAKAARP